MSRTADLRTPVALLALAAALGLLLSGCARSAETISLSDTTQTSIGGEVEVTVTWQDPSAGLVFEITMDTDSANLDDYDLRRLAVLRIDRGQEVQPAAWEPFLRGEHHQSGILTFPATAPDGSLVLPSGPHIIELVIRAVGGVPERIFRWTT